MSQTQARIDKPDPIADQMAIAQFKERFGVGRANELTQAQETRSGLQTTVFTAQDELLVLQGRTEAAKTQFDKSVEADKSWKAKTYNKTQEKPRKQAEAAVIRDRKIHEDLVEECKNKTDVIEQGLKDLAIAERALEKLERTSYKEKVHALIKRLKIADEARTGEAEGIALIEAEAPRQRGKVITDQLWAAFNDAIRNDSLVAMEQTLKAAETEVLDVVSDVELEPARSGLSQRLDELANGAASEKVFIDTTRKSLATATLAMIEKTLEPAVALAEAQALDVIKQQTVYAKRIAALRQKAVPADLSDTLVVDLDKADKRGKTKLSEAAELYRVLGEALGKAEAVASEHERAARAYAGRVQAIGALIKQFTSDPFLKGWLPANHPTPAKVLEEAASYTAENEHLAAQMILNTLDDRLQAALAKGKARKAGKDAQEAQKAEDDKKRQLEEERKQKEAAAQLAREQADTPDSLDAIGRDQRFGEWMVKLLSLQQAGTVTVACPGGAAPYGNVRNRNFEAVVNVTAPQFATYFVVHYHGGAQAPDINNPYASRVHAKPDSFINRRIYLDNGHWVFNFAPQTNRVI